MLPIFRLESDALDGDRHLRYLTYLDTMSTPDNLPLSAARSPTFAVIPGPVSPAVMVQDSPAGSPVASRHAEV